MPIDLDDGLARWQQAGVIDAEQAARIRQIESVPVPHHGVSLTEVMLSTGALLGIAGVYLEVYLHASDVKPGWRSAFNAAVVALAAVAALAMMNRGDGALRRGAAMVATLACVAAGAATFEACIATDFLVTQRVVTFDAAAPAPCPPSQKCVAVPPVQSSYIETDHQGAGLLASSVTTVAALFVMAAFAGGVAALVVGVGAVTAGALFNNMLVGKYHLTGDNTSQATVAALIFCTVGMGLYAAGSLPRLGRAAETLLRFGGIAVAVIVLVAVGPEHAWLPGALVAGAVSGAALAAGDRMHSVATLSAGGFGLFAVAVDIGARTFADQIGFPIFMVLCGFGLVGTTLMLRSAVLARRAPAGPAA